MPFNFKLERDGYPRLLNFAAGDLIRLPVGALSGTTDYLPKNDTPWCARCVQRYAGCAPSTQDKPATVAALRDFFEIDEPTASDLYDAVADSYTLDGRIAASAIREALETGDEAGRNADPQQMVDFRYLDLATQMPPVPANPPPTEDAMPHQSLDEFIAAADAAGEARTLRAPTGTSRSAA